MNRLLLLLTVLHGLNCCAAAAPAEEKWGTIKGRVVWGGDEIPEPEDLIPVVKRLPDGKYCLKKGKVFDQKWVVNKKNKGLRWTFVWLASPNPKQVIPIHPNLEKPDKPSVLIEEKCCMYEPYAIGMRQGQDLIVKNSDDVAHHVVFIGLDPPGAAPVIGPAKVKNVVAGAPAILSCSIHPWMRAYVRVFDHPYFAVTDEDGNFEIKGAPAGTYHLVVWHGTGGWRFGAKGRNGEPIEIRPDRVNDLGNLNYPPPKD